MVPVKVNTDNLIDETLIAEAGNTTPTNNVDPKKTTTNDFSFTPKKF